MKNQMKINLGTIAMVNILAFMLSALAESLIPAPVAFLLFFGTGLVFLMKPVYEIFRMDFNLSTESIELVELYEDLSSKAGR